MVRDRIHGRSRDALSAEVLPDLTAAEGLWRALEEAPGAVSTPYQRFDWVAAFAGATGPEPVRVVVLRDALGRAQMLLPLRVTRSGGVAVARVVGAKHANFHMPLYASRQAACLPAEAIEAALVRAGRALGLDAYALDHQPRFWDGLANPLANPAGARARPCPSDAYGLMLGPDPEATLRRAFSAEARKKLRAKERRLAEAHGRVEHRVADTPEAVAGILAAFLAQKRLRLAALGLRDPYAEPGIAAFLAAASAPGGARPAAVAVHALVIPESGRVLATFGGAVDAGRFSGMWTSFDADPEVARFSPGDLLLHRLVAHETARGRRALDLGVGAARYKASICDETIELVEVLIPVTPRGHLFALASDARAALERRVRGSPRLLRALRRIRRSRRD